PTHRYCTNCVLKQHPGLFCPLCFELHEDAALPPPPHHRLMCVRCPSVAHRSCAFPSTTASAAPPPPFFCPTCLDANFTFLNLPDRKTGAVDVRSAKVLVARRAREAAVARKRAKEALEHLAEVLACEQAERDELKEQNGVASAGRRRAA
ncbi:uncharacterized protein LOC109807364, partial [Cajanus cajan]|uniref:uncharacterized protein LOC109807364 n=1 Tax=Cajanus cajan TaxID=3821 RepID=UPI00098DA613